MKGRAARAGPRARLQPRPKKKTVQRSLHEVKNGDRRGQSWRDAAGAICGKQKLAPVRIQSGYNTPALMPCHVGWDTHTFHRSRGRHMGCHTMWDGMSTPHGSADWMDFDKFPRVGGFQIPAPYLPPAGKSVLRRPNDRRVRSWELEAVRLNPRRAFVKRSAFVLGARANARDLQGNKGNVNVYTSDSS